VAGRVTEPAQCALYIRVVVDDKEVCHLSAHLYGVARLTRCYGKMIALTAYARECIGGQARPS